MALSRRKEQFESDLKEAESKGNERIAAAFGELVRQVEEVLKKKLTDEEGNHLVENQEHRYVAEQAARFNLDALDIRSPQRRPSWKKCIRPIGRPWKTPSTSAIGR